jgi:hypothetical protein
MFIIQATGQYQRLSAVDVLIKVACFVMKIDIIFNLISSWSKQVSGRRRSTVLSFPLQWRFPAHACWSIASVNEEKKVLQCYDQNAAAVGGSQTVPKMQPGSPIPSQPGSGTGPGPASQVPGALGAAGPGFVQGQQTNNAFRLNSQGQTPLAFLEKTTTTIGR